MDFLRILFLGVDIGYIGSRPSSLTVVEFSRGSIEYIPIYKVSFLGV